MKREEYPVGAKQLLDALGQLIKLDSIEDLVREGIVFICRQLGASSGKVLRRSPTNPEYLEFWYGYSVENGFWSSEKKDRCSVPILIFEDQKKIRRALRSISGNVFLTKEMFIIENTAKNPYSDFFLEFGEDVKSEIIAPITSYENRLELIVCLSSQNASHFLEHNRDEYNTFCSLLEILFNQKLQKEDISKNTDYYSALLKSKRSQKSGEKYSLLMKSLTERLQNEYCGIYSFSPDFSYMIKLGDYGTSTDYSLFSHNWCETSNLAIGKKELIGFLESNKRYAIWESLKVLLVKIEDIYGYYSKRGVIGVVAISLFPDIIVSEEINEELFSFILDCIETFNDQLLREQTRAIARTEDAIRSITEEDLRGVHGPAGALEQVIKRMDYTAIHIWIRDRSRMRLVAPQSLYRKGYAVSIGKSCLVTNAYHSGEISFRYDLKKEDVEFVFPEIIPANVDSWMGFPIVSKDDEERVVGIISCFDRFEEEANVALSIIDIPIMGFLSTIILLALELERVKIIKTGKQSIASHEISLQLGCLQGNIDILYDRLKNPSSYMPEIITSRPDLFIPRDDDTIYENTNNFIAGIKVSLLRESILSGRLKIHKTKYSLNKCVSSTVSMYRTMLRRRTWYKKDVRIKFDRIYGLFNIDNVAMQEVLLNLLSNATKYSDENGIIRIRYPKKGVLRICNNGIGVPPDEAELIFSPNYQATNAKECNKKYLGPGGEYRDQGLGLTICQQLMTSMGGDIVLLNAGYKSGQETIFEISVGKENFI